jgi:hypothetical protein
MSTRHLPGGKGRPAREPPSLSRLSSKCGSLDVSQPSSTACYRDSFTFSAIITQIRLCNSLSLAISDEWTLTEERKKKMYDDEMHYRRSIAGNIFGDLKNYKNISDQKNNVNAYVSRTKVLNYSEE